MPSILEEIAAVEDVKAIAEDIYRLRLKSRMADSAIAGQFVNLYIKDGAHLLPRPISISRIDKIIIEKY